MCLMYNLNFFIMLNLSFSPPPITEKPFVSGFKTFVEKQDTNGRVSLVPCDYPYEGLDAASFDLQNQLDAGVPLEKIAPISGSSLGTVDSNNENAESFINSLKNE